MLISAGDIRGSQGRSYLGRREISLLKSSHLPSELSAHFLNSSTSRLQESDIIGSFISLNPWYLY